MEGVRPDPVVVASRGLEDDLGLAQSVEDLPVEQLREGSSLHEGWDVKWFVLSASPCQW